MPADETRIVRLSHRIHSFIFSQNDIGRANNINSPGLATVFCFPQVFATATPDSRIFLIE
jgi:hypothetical protein